MSYSIAQSEALFAAAQKHIPGGVNSPVRAFKGVGGTPIFFDHAKGAYVFDADGNRDRVMPRQARKGGLMQELL